MSTLADLVTFITEDTSFFALAGERLYPLTLPQEPTFPAATYMLVDNPHEFTHNGTRTHNPRLQVDCYGGTYLQAKALADVIEVVCTHWNAAFSAPAFAENMIDVPEPDLPPLGRRFRKTVDITVWGLQ